MRLRKVLLTNAHSSNTGDLAIQCALIQHLRKLSKDVEIVFHCSHPEISRNHTSHKNVKFRSYLWPIFKDTPTFRNCIDFAFVIFANLLSAFSYRFFKKGIPFLNRSDTSLGDFLDSDIVISIGGGYLSHDYGFARPYCDCIISKVLGKKLVLYGHSIGPFGGHVNRFVSSLVLRNADLIIVREERSKCNLEELGIKNVYTTTDIAFSLDPIPKSTPNNTTVICAMEPIYRYQHKRAEYISFISKLARKITGESKGKVILLPTTPEDISFHKSLRSHLPKEVEYVDKILYPSQAAELLSKANFIISSRMHSIILGSLSATPSFALGWEYKLDEITSMLYSKQCSVRATKLDDQVQELILERMKQADELSDEISKNLPFLSKKAQQNIEILRQNLEEWGYSFD